MKKLISSLTAVAFLSGCVSLPPDAFVVTPEHMKRRQMETRRYDGAKEQDILVASSNVLQDLGYSIENSETRLGVITASKQRDATSGAEVAAAVAVALLGGGVMAISKDQTIRVSLVVRPVKPTAGNTPVNDNFVRITFQRMVRKTDNSVVVESLSDQKLYEGFFDKLSKSVFLQAQNI